VFVSAVLRNGTVRCVRESDGSGSKWHVASERYVGACFTNGVPVYLRTGERASK